MSQKASEVAETAKFVGSKVGMTVYEGSLTAKQKFDEAGGQEVAKQTADAACDGAMWVGDKALTGAKFVGNTVNDKIEANPTLSNIKRQGSLKIGEAASFMSSLVMGCIEESNQVPPNLDNPDNPYHNNQNSQF